MFRSNEKRTNLRAVSPDRNFGWRCALAVLVSGWLVCAATGMAVLARYEFTPGQAASTQPVWPPDSSLTLDETNATLLMFVHPHCPCSRASLDQLDRIMARCEHRLTACVVFCVPAGFDEQWAQSDLWKIANSMTNVCVIVDQNSVETKRFGARTSGHALLYDAEGRLQFAGGITASRGHSGDSLGQQQIVSIILESADTPVLAECSAFGCPLFDDDQQ